MISIAKHFCTCLATLHLPLNFRTMFADDQWPCPSRTFLCERPLWTIPCVTWKRDRHFQAFSNEKTVLNGKVVWEPLFAHLPMKLAGTTLTRRWTSIPPSALKTSLTLPCVPAVGFGVYYVPRTHMNTRFSVEYHITRTIYCSSVRVPLADQLGLHVFTISWDFRVSFSFRPRIREPVLGIDENVSRFIVCESW